MVSINDGPALLVDYDVSLAIPFNTITLGNG